MLFNYYIRTSHHKIQPLKLVVLLPTQILHPHNLDHQTCPAGEMLRPLSRACLGIVLLPRKPGALPLVEDVGDKVYPQARVHVSSLLLVPARGLRDYLQEGVSDECSFLGEGWNAQEDSSRPYSSC